MKTAHLILAHSAPQQLSRMIRRLQHPQAVFFVHLDRKTETEPFLPLADMEHVHFIRQREKISWGGYSIVQATINGLKEISSSDYDFTHINLLSGQDYPLIHTDRIHEYLHAHAESNFMLFRSVEQDWQEAIPRLRKYHFTHYRFPGSYKVQHLINRLLPERTMPRGLIPVGRSQWMTLSMPAVSYIIEYLNAHPDVVRFFKWTWAPDELIFQTILYNSTLRDKMVNEDLRYIDWSEGLPSPKTLTMDDAEQLKASGKFFARKFDMQRHPQVLDYLDDSVSGIP